MLSGTSLMADCATTRASPPRCDRCIAVPVRLVAVRQASLALFRHLPTSSWQRRGVASNHAISVRALAYVIAGHVRHHFEVLDTGYGE